jgi:hypothetical protein
LIFPCKQFFDMLSNLYVWFVVYLTASNCGMNEEVVENLHTVYFFSEYHKYGRNSDIVYRGDNN